MTSPSTPAQPSTIHVWDCERDGHYRIDWYVGTGVDAQRIWAGCFVCGLVFP